MVKIVNCTFHNTWLSSGGYFTSKPYQGSSSGDLVGYNALIHRLMITFNIHIAICKHVKMIHASNYLIKWYTL